jgi:hypothetical protein
MVMDWKVGGEPMDFQQDRDIMDVEATFINDNTLDGDIQTSTWI